jgi:nucleoside-diphosphate-sugar epimerase
MKIFVIGGNSALAKAVIPIIGSHEIITAGRKGCDTYCDITESVTIPNDVDVVLNFAATFGGDSDEAILEAERTNSLGVLNICSALRKANVKHFINISSMSATHDETSAYYSIYAITKRHGDELAQYYCKLFGISLTILRPTQLYGDNDEFTSHQPFFHHLVNNAEKGQDIIIYGSRDALRNYIHSVDLGEIIKRVVSDRVTGTYPCMYPADVSFSEIAQTAQKIFGQGGEIIFQKDKPDILDNVFTKDLTIYEKLKYQPTISLQTGLERIKEYRSQKV